MANCWLVPVTSMYTARSLIMTNVDWSLVHKRRQTLVCYFMRLIIVYAGYTKLLIRTVDTDVVACSCLFRENWLQSTVACFRHWPAFQVYSCSWAGGFHRAPICLCTAHLPCHIWMWHSLSLCWTWQEDLLGDLEEIPRGHRRFCWIISATTVDFW